MPFIIVRDDIVHRDVDAVVNAANSQLLAGGGVCGAIFAKAGHAKLQAACDEIGFCPTGSAVITPGFHLKARYIIHAVGPVWKGGRQGEREKLASAYASALELAWSHDLSSIAFPLLSSGIYGVPREISLLTALDTFRDFLEDHEMDIELVLFDTWTLPIDAKMHASIRSYIDDRYVERAKHDNPYFRRGLAVPSSDMASPPDAGDEDAVALPADMRPSSYTTVGSGAARKSRSRELEDIVANADEPFSTMLLRLIDESGMTDPVVYHRANMSRKLFSKIRSDEHYRPSKRTALALAVALELDLDQATDLLATAGFTFSPSSVFDLIVRFFIESGDFDIYHINSALYSFDQPLLCD